MMVLTVLNCQPPAPLFWMLPWRKPFFMRCLNGNRFQNSMNGNQTNVWGDTMFLTLRVENSELLYLITPTTSAWNHGSSRGFLSLLLRCQVPIHEIETLWLPFGILALRLQSARLLLLALCSMPVAILISFGFMHLGTDWKRRWNHTKQIQTRWNKTYFCTVFESLWFYIFLTWI